MKIHVQQDSDSWRDKVRRKVVNKNHLAQTDMEQESQGGRGWEQEEGRGAVAPEVGDLSIESRER